jgi:hypothetical protein
VTEAAPRPDVVQAVYDSIMTMNPAKLEALEAAGTHVTAAERAQARQLVLSSLLASEDYLDRRAEVWHVLIAREWDSPARGTRAPSGAVAEHDRAATPVEETCRRRRCASDGSSPSGDSGTCRSAARGGATSRRQQEAVGPVILIS